MAYVRIVVPVAIIAAAVVIGTIFLLPRGPDFTLDMQEFGYNDFTGGPTLKVRVGDTVRITLKNIGGAEHEFKVVEDKDMSITVMRNVIKDLQSDGLSKAEQIERYDEMRRNMVEDMVAFPGAQVDLKPTETKTIEFVAERPGTFWYVCHNVGGSFPELHQDRGMFGQIIVEA